MTTGTARLANAVHTYNSELFIKLVDLVDDCSYSQDNGCLQCPHLARCTKWWDRNVCEHISGYHSNLRSYDTFAKRFERIRTGQYSHSNNGNGHNGNGG